MIRRKRVQKAIRVNEAEGPFMILKRQEVARMFRVCPQRVDQLARAGVINRVTLPGSSRALGYLESDIVALISNGKAGAR